ncbi:MAG: ABC transporter permease [Chloroflexi bacterium]|nr:ABC transporter permease [Chloroflexota bacterium]
METITKETPRRTVLAETLPPKERMPRWIRIMLRSPVSITGIVLVILFIAVAALAPVLAPPEFPSQPFLIPESGFSPQPLPPSAAHPFGTTQNQYDLFYGVVWGTRTAFEVGILVTLTTVLIGAGFGAIFAYTGGWMDEVFQRIVELFLAFPFLLAAITLATVLGATIHNGLVTGMIALIVFGWPSYSRQIRGDILSVKERDFVLAAHAIGTPGWRILLIHILPNAMYSTLVVSSLNIGNNVLTFAALSFLGLGAPQGYADWGQLLSLARNWIPSLSQYWYIVVFPGIALLLFVLAWNLIGDAFRDALDPKMSSYR